MLIKKLLSVLLLCTFFCLPVSSLQESDLSARSAVVIDSETNNVIYQKNMSEKLSMASTTKIMTAILAIESGKLSCVVTADRDVICEGTSIGIKKGDSFTLETLIWALLLESGNDSAVLIAEFLSGNETEFSKRMNEKASQIGMKNTNFVTASGLDDSEHYTTAYDMALLASYAAKNPIFRRICSRENYVADYISPKISVTYSNHNKLLKMYDGTFGVKTGFTKKSGRCLVSACERNGITLVAVTLKAPDDWNDHIKLYNYCFKLSQTSKIDIQVPRLRVYGADVEWLEPVCDNVCVNSLFYDNISYTVLLPQFTYAPIKKNDHLGKIILYVDGRKYKELEIKADSDILPAEGKTEIEYTFFDKLKHIFRFISKG